MRKTTHKQAPGSPDNFYGLIEPFMEATQNQLLRDLSERLFSGSAAQLAMHALAMQPASAEELEEIRTLIERKRQTR